MMNFTQNAPIRLLTLLCALLLHAQIAATTPSKPIKLESEALAFADGMAIGIGPKDIGLTLKILQLLSDMQTGHKNQQGVRVGLFTFEGNLYNIKELRKIEADIEVELCKVQGTPNAALAKKKAAIKATHREAQLYIENNVLSALEQVNEVRGLIMTLVKESCKKRNRTESLLLAWSACEEGKEAETMRHVFISFKLIDSFVSDLQDFLKDFVYSCPKARAQFMKTVNPNQHKDIQ